MAIEAHVDVKVTMAWWYRPYLTVLMWFAALTGQEPDEDKLVEVIRRAIRIELGPARRRDSQGSEG